MALENSNRKRAVVQKSPSGNIQHQVRFQPWRFDNLVFDKGYEVYIDRAYRCPCSVKGAGQPLVDCKNCLGVGWVFANRIETRIAVQAIKADIKYENWSQTTAGTAKITARAIDKLAFMDRIILKDVEGYYNEILRSKKINGENKFFTNYEIIAVQDIMLFEGSSEPLMHLKEGIDYKIDVNNPGVIELMGAFRTSTTELVATIKYKHLQTYHILDMNRDITKVREKGCLMPDEQLKEMPIMGIARKAHYLFDNLKYRESTDLIDNTK